jgi:hypothetical protein
VLEQHFVATGFKTFGPSNGVARLKKAGSLNMRMNATGRPIRRE